MRFFLFLFGIALGVAGVERGRGLIVACQVDLQRLEQRTKARIAP